MVSSRTSHVAPSGDIPDRYARVSGDNSPVHLDEQLARSVGLPGVILHGMYLFGVAMRVGSVEVDEDPRRVKSAAARFSAPAVPDCELLIEAVTTSREPDDIEIAIRMSQRNVDVLSAAKVIARPDQ
ncbi:MaoC/PaaZ C-terminal domain-containing protein [Micromonospora sp. ATA51]|uniref:MaoC/PaaZ C-terminal domain-containing protein n=1 Tax=Micromonospora sp. ATA51 TaxID=2806098 RepID=UPI001A517C43|nr:MaoC/PaaZ C-terminal domain-containing protein [Micromonospora sp. ATA51]MBM0229089.1 hypothetical protein [Micromonospora sp. ATA51]